MILGSSLTVPTVPTFLEETERGEEGGWPPGRPAARERAREHVSARGGKFGIGRAVGPEGPAGIASHRVRP